jgi:hypothetical protein
MAGSTERMAMSVILALGMGGVVGVGMSLLGLRLLLGFISRGGQG